MTNKFAAIGAKAAAESNADMTKPQAGGGDYTPPAAGPCRLRLVGYIEIGKQHDTFQGKPVQKEKVKLIFEVSGPKHTPAEGQKPYLIEIEENYSLNEKANLFKLFNRLNYSGKFVHFAELLDQPFKGEIVHRTYKGRDGKERIAADLFDKARGYLIDAPRREDEEGNIVPIKVAERVTPLRCFVWSHPDKDQWDSLFIDGSWPARKDEKTGAEITPERSKNVYQNAIKAAVNFKGSPAAALLLGADEIDTSVETTDVAPEGAPWVGDGDDALNGIGA